MSLFSFLKSSDEKKVARFTDGLCRAMLISYLAAMENPKCKTQAKSYSDYAAFALADRSRWRQLNPTTFAFVNGDSINIIPSDSLKSVVEKVATVEIRHIYSHEKSETRSLLLGVAFDVINNRFKANVEVKNIIPEIGKEISWADIVNHSFRVFEFDRNETIVNENNQVKAKSSFQPYGYLLVSSPILNNRVRLPIIHRDDFLLAASVFDEPQLIDLVDSEELLVTYAPKQLLPKGLSGSPHHVLHYTIVPSGTLDSYYSVNNDMHMAKPDPQKLFGPFVYEGEIKVQINSEPKF